MAAAKFGVFGNNIETTGTEEKRARCHLPADRSFFGSRDATLAHPTLEMFYSFLFFIYIQYIRHGSLGPSEAQFFT